MYLYDPSGWQLAKTCSL